MTLSTSIFLIYLYELIPVLVIAQTIQEDRFKSELWDGGKKFYALGIVIFFSTPLLLFFGIEELYKKIVDKIFAEKRARKKRIEELEKEVHSLSTENYDHVRDLIAERRKVLNNLKKIKELQKENRKLKGENEKYKKNDPYELIKNEIGL